MTSLTRLAAARLVGLVVALGGAFGLLLTTSDSHGDPLPFGGNASYNQVQNQGATSLQQRSVLNCSGAGITCADDSVNHRTNLTVPACVPLTRTLTTTAPLRCGGADSCDLSSDRTLSVTLYGSRIYGQIVGTLSAGTTKYMKGIGGVASATAFPLGGATHADLGETVQRLHVSCQIAPGGSETLTFTVITSTDDASTWSDTAVTCTVTGSAKSCDSSALTAAISTADTLYGLKAVISGASLAQTCTASFETL